VPAQAVRSGRDLMLATRGIKFIRSDFEFQRAFSPGDDVIALLSEDTLICRGLNKYRFSDNSLLAAVFNYQGREFLNIIGRNDTIFLTRNHFFDIDSGFGLGSVNSFEVSNIRLVIVDKSRPEFAVRDLEIPPFNLYFLDDIITYFVAANYDGLIMNPEDIFNMLIPNFISERQIQREINLLSVEEARKWLNEKIIAAFGSQ
jgi:hypothetical protein